jgi:hypothetical protein
MAHQPGTLLHPRPLSQPERELVGWLLSHGTAEGQQFLSQLADAEVASHCACGCASIDFAIAGKRPATFAMRVLSDYQWRDGEGHLFGAFVFEQDGLLAGLDLWSIDGAATPRTLPPIASLVPCGTLDA